MKMPKIKRVHHVAVVVEDLERALSFWRDLLGLPLGEVRDVTVQQTRVAFLSPGGTQVELVKPTTGDSGVARFLAKRGPGMHHLSLEVDDLEALLARLKAGGVRLINETPLVNAAGKKYAFVHPDSTGGVLLELSEE
jgi:methylmalonyl-CoA/ethylmalonyl-CoA epimerase